MLTLRLDADTENRLAFLAERTGRTKSYYAKEAILNYLEDLEDAYLADQEIVEIRNGTSRVYSLEEVKQHLGMEN